MGFWRKMVSCPIATQDFIIWIKGEIVKNGIFVVLNEVDEKRE